MQFLKEYEAQFGIYKQLERDREKIEEGKIEELKEIIQDNLRELGNVNKSGSVFWRYFAPRKNNILNPIGIYYKDSWNGN